MHQSFVCAEQLVYTLSQIHVRDDAYNWSQQQAGYVWYSNENMNEVNS